MFQMNTLISNRSVPLNANIGHRLKWYIANTLPIEMDGCMCVCAFERNQWSVQCHSHSSISPLATEIEANPIIFTFCIDCQSLFAKVCRVCELICNRRRDVAALNFNKVLNEPIKAH